jgi:Calcineurin-like phosphoesterase
MSKTLVISDLHLGVQRTGGTTNTSATALREYGHQKHKDLLELAADGDTIIVNGDLTDTYDIPLGQALEVYSVASHYLQTHPNSRMFWSVGNHDLSKDSAKLGTVSFIGRLLRTHFRGRFFLLEQAELVNHDIWVIPHVANQELFDLELKRVPDEAKYVLLHANFDNAFAGQSDHSLNISRDQAKVLTKQGKTLILGHEHQGRTLMNDKVIIVGNQFPSSVSDCLRHGDAQVDGHKYCLMIDGDDMELIPTWSVKDPVGWFQEIDWRALDTAKEGQGFIRVTGAATSDEAQQVIKALSTLRQSSEAFVITNAVKVESHDNLNEIEASIEEIRSVNVIDLLMGMLDEDQAAVIRNLLKEEQQ